MLLLWSDSFKVRGSDRVVTALIGLLHGDDFKENMSVVLYHFCLTWILVNI